MLSREAAAEAKVGHFLFPAFCIDLILLRRRMNPTNNFWILDVGNMTGKTFWINLVAIVLGSGLGSFTGHWGAIGGGLIGFLIPYSHSAWWGKLARLKRKILLTIHQHPEAISVREIMRMNGTEVPEDCFIYDLNHQFVKALIEYRAACLELESEHQIVHNSKASSEIGYVDPPNEWLNEWAGRAYQIFPISISNN